MSDVSAHESARGLDTVIVSIVNSNNKYKKPFQKLFLNRFRSQICASIVRAARVYSRIANTMDRLQEILKTFSPDTIFSNFDN